MKLNFAKVEFQLKIYILLDFVKIEFQKQKHYT